MYKKRSLVLSIFTLLFMLSACQNNDDIEALDDPYTYVEETEPTLEALRMQFELFFEENRATIIETIAVEGEDVRLELADGYEFTMTILLDDIELNDENRALYILTFELTFSQMNELFGNLAQAIKIAAGLDHFRLSVIFVDVNEAIIARSNFDAGERVISLDPIYE
ncbi:MAG: hypothetical protein FWG67_01130 [Defluviitaleaceae bacterium]|nr:hypothetical protein [Defluviitaleaceae bacterium]